MEVTMLLWIIPFLFHTCEAGVMMSVNNRSVEISHEKLLMRHLLENYEAVGKGGRPVVDNDKVLEVKFGLGLIQMDLNEKDNVLQTSMWAKMAWQDDYLTWDPAEYGSVGVIHLDSKQIWIPDVMLLNTADPETASRHVPITVRSDGTVSWVPHQIFKSSCSTDVSEFPFDQQVCEMAFGSWTHSEWELNLTMVSREGLELSTYTEDYRQGCEWEIKNHTAYEVVDHNGFKVITIELVLNRKLVFSSYILTLPCIFLAFLTLVVFCLPPERPDRTGLAMSLFSSFLVLLLILVEAAPPTAASVPKLGLYYCFNMVIIMLSVFLSSLVVHVNKQANREPPTWIKMLMLEGLARVLLMHPNPCCGSNCKFRHITSSTSCDEDPDSLPLIRSNMAAANDVTQATPTATTAATSFERHLYNMEVLMSQLLGQISRMTSFQDLKRQESGKFREITQQWKAIGRVLDRLFVVIYLACIIISLRVLFPVPPLAYLIGRSSDEL